ncbi:hypothetical protein KCU78_g456, partial [Aureobasidium melanogenum]
MSSYSIAEESRKILFEKLLSDPTLNIPKSIRDAANKVKFVGGRSTPFVPTPFKMTESSTSLHALVAAAASAIASDRYKIDLQDIEVNSDLATLFLESVGLISIDGKPAVMDPGMQKELAKIDLHDMSSQIRRCVTLVYQTKDNRWYQLHGSMNATPTMDMMGVENDTSLTREQAIEIYKDKVLQWNSAEIEKTANEKYRQAGVVCYTPEEFFSSEHGKIMGAEPLWTVRPFEGARKAWPAASTTEGYKPLQGIRVIDFSRVIAAPVISKILAFLGADVIRISFSGNPDYPGTMPDLQTGKRDVDINIKTPEGIATFKELLKDADVLVDGFRPGAFAKLGFSSASMREINPSLIYVRENCYGFKGPLSSRSGWQQISDCLVGLSYTQGKFLGLEEAVVPLFPNSDYQTGLIGAAAVLQALLQRVNEDRTFDIDVSLTQYNIWFYRLGLYDEVQQQALLEQDPDFAPRSKDDMGDLVAKTHASLTKVRKDFVKPEYYWDMSGKDWGLDKGMKVLKPAFLFSQTRLGYNEPSGRRGRSEPKWL